MAVENTLAYYDTATITVEIFILQALNAHPMEQRYNGKLLAFPSNIGLGWKCQAVPNAVGYSIAVIITTVKSFIVLAVQSYNR